MLSLSNSRSSMFAINILINTDNIYNQMITNIKNAIFLLQFQILHSRNFEATSAAPETTLPLN